MIKNDEFILYAIDQQKTFDVQSKMLEEQQKQIEELMKLLRN